MITHLSYWLRRRAVTPNFILSGVTGAGVVAWALIVAYFEPPWDLRNRPKHMHARRVGFFPTGRELLP